MPKLIIPDAEIAQAAVRWWPNPTSGYYQAKIMTTIALMESIDGNAYALLMNAPPSVLAGYVDRGLWGINEGALFEILGYWVDPATFVDPVENGRYARIIWDWRYQAKLRATGSVSAALLDAYRGWTTYKRAHSGLPEDAAYKQAWDARWPRAVAAVNAVTT